MWFKMSVLKNLANFTGKHLCWSIFIIKRPANLLRGTLTQAFYCEICYIIRNTFFCRTTPVSASVLKQNSITAICFQIVIITKIQSFEFNLNSKLRLRLATIRIRSFFSNFLLQFKFEASFSTMYHNWSSELRFPIAFKIPLRNFNYNFLFEFNFEVSFPKSHLNLFIHFI